MAGSLVATHNLRHFQRLMLDIRQAIRDNDWSAFGAGWPGLGPISPHCLDCPGAHFMPHSLSRCPFCFWLKRRCPRRPVLPQVMWPRQPMGGMSWLILFGFLGLMLFMTSTAGRKQRKQHEALMASLKKRDRVVTTGGVMGVVVDVFDDRVVLKVDESTNTRMTFVREAISRRIESEQSEDDSANPND